MINPWWVHHCAGNLEQKNDPYSEKYENPFSDTSIKGWQMILIGISLIFHTVWYGFGVWYGVKFFDSLALFFWWDILFIALFIVWLLLYAFANIKTIRLILR